MSFLNRSEQNDGKNITTINSCCAGEIIPLERLSNDVFSSLILGDGFGVIPSDGRMVCPVSGVVKDVSDSGYDVTIKTDDGLLLIVSVGISSHVKTLEAQCAVSAGDKITSGDLLWDIDGELLGWVTAAVVVTNSVKIPSFNIRYGKVKQPNLPVMTITI